MQDYFYELARFVEGELRGDEVCTTSYRGEDSDFARFNQSGVRQAGSVSQKTLGLDLINARRHATASLGLSGNAEIDRARLRGLLSRLREQCEQVPEDPLLQYSRDVNSTEHHAPEALPDPDQVLGEVLRAGRDRDLVGIWASGAMQAGFANSLGQRNWDSRSSFNLDWSFYCRGDKAAKASYAGFDWSSDEFSRRAERAAEQLHALERTPRTIQPGRYRVYLAPVALLEIVDMLRWGGFGLRAHRTKTTPLLRMIEEGARLSRTVTMVENTADGVAPGFQEAGYLKPPQVTLIHDGAYQDTLVSPRSALEYDVPTNGASNAETPLSIELAGGDLGRDRVLEELGTGIYVSNLWYLNYSDRNACRTTGMTRFATFWVENGTIEAPLEVMRFDETVFRMLGENLRALTRERELILDAGSYGRRSSGSARLPGALIEDFVFTL